MRKLQDEYEVHKKYIWSFTIYMNLQESQKVQDKKYIFDMWKHAYKCEHISNIEGTLWHHKYGH